MANPADKYAQKTFSQLESQMSRQYREAYKDVSKKLQDFTRRHKAKDKQMQRDLKKGEITQEQYASWLRGQVFIGQQWQDAKASLDLSIKNVMTEAAHLTHQKSIDVFVDNANYTAYQIEKDHGFTGGVNFTMYDRKTVSRLMLEDPELLPRRRNIDGKKLEAWNTKVIANCVTQSILQGESIDELSKRIARDTCIDAGRSSLLYARTAMTGAQNAGRVERMKEAEEMGIKVEKQWMSTLDSRTRDSHRDMDGETVPVDEEFSNGLEYPGDYDGDPEEVYNCRCTLIYHYPEYSDYSNMERTAYYDEEDPEYDPDHRNYETVTGMNYEQWTNYKQDQIRQRYSGLASEEGDATVSGLVNYGRAVNDIPSESHRKSVQERLDKAPEAIQHAWNKASSELSGPQWDGDSVHPAYYSGKDGKTHFVDAKEAFSKSSYQEENAVYFHEYGHNIDHVLGGGGAGYSHNEYLSVTYNNGEFGKTLEEEIQEHLRKFYIDTNPDDTYAKLLDRDDFSMLQYTGMLPGAVPVDREMTQALGRLRRAGDIDFETYIGLKETVTSAYEAHDFDKLRTIFNTYVSGDSELKQTVDWMREHANEAINMRANKKENATAFCEAIKNSFNIYQRSDISDIFDGYLSVKCDLEWGMGPGHGTSYFRTRANHPIEAFAEMYSATAVNGESLPVIKEFFPKSYDVFMKMIGGQ